MTKKESKTVEVNKSTEEKVSNTETKSSKKVKSSLKLDLSKFNFQSKTFNVLVAFIFIVLSMWVAWDVRDGAINLDGLDKNIESSIYSNVQQVISQQVNAEYPNLNEIYKEEKIAKEYAVVVETGKFNYQGQELIISELVASQADSYKDQYKADNGQTYLTAIDPYHFIGLSKNYLANGHSGTTLDSEGNPVIEYKLAPVGTSGSTTPVLHIWLESKLFSNAGLTENSSFGELTSSVFALSAILATLVSIPIFLIIRKFSNNLFALFGTLILLTIGTFVSRTVAGFVDTDAYQILFPLSITASLVYALVSSNKTLNILLSALSGLFFGLFIWSWSNGWFFFVFILASLIGYLIYDLISNKLSENKTLSETLSKLGLSIITFLVSTFIFVKLLANVNIFQKMFEGLTSGLSGVTSVSTSNIWPNVFTSVAELNPASFGQIVNSVGGALVFIISMIALVFLVLDYKSSNNKQNLYKRLVIVFSFIWTILFVNNTFTFLTANSGFLFIVLLFLPVMIAMILALLNRNTSIKIFMSMLLSIWMAGTIYMSFNGVRFILLLAPAFAISAGIGLYYIYIVCNNFFEKELKPKSYVGTKIGGLLVSSIIFLTIFTPMYSQAQNISDNTVPNFNDDWYNVMEKIKTDSSEDTIITSWWDFGHFFAAVGERGVTFDGGSQTTPRAHWVGKLLMENDEAVAQDILQMLVCGGNEAHNTFLEKTSGSTADAIKINKVLYKTFGLSNNETRDVLVNNEYYNLSESDVDEIMVLLSCENPRENLLITSNDMVGKAGVWAHWGSWDFEKKYVSDYYLTKSAEEIAVDIDANVTVVSAYIDELIDIDLRAKTQNIKRADLINQWYAPYPSYVPIQGNYYVPCQINNASSILCAQGIEVESNGFDMSIKSIANEQITINNIVYPTQLGTLKTSLNDPNGQFDLMLIPSGSGYQSVLAQAPLGASLFSRLYFYNGYGSTNFELFDSKTNTQNPITVWSTLWEPKTEQDIIGAALEKLQPTVDEVVSFENSTSENN